MYRKHNDKTQWKINAGVNANKQLGQLMPYQYTGGYTDGNTGLVHLDARWYNPHTSRFVQPDYWSLKNTYLPTEIQHELIRFTGLNASQLLRDPSQQLAYGYVSGNPLVWVDPFGLAESYVFDLSSNGDWIPVTDMQRDELNRSHPQTAEGVLASSAGESSILDHNTFDKTEQKKALVVASIVVNPISTPVSITLGFAAASMEYQNSDNPDEYVGTAVSIVSELVKQVHPALRPLAEAVDNFNTVNDAVNVIGAEQKCSE
ncbi:RHS repeat-associated core domain-containing protein [Vibrio sp. TRT 29B02]|uniref:RHS repeat-associated core domain-containing protein n=1 Tax=Vibrio sp. TRT 29B02 TaxID=3418508 RepID=UPI003CED3C49